VDLLLLSLIAGTVVVAAGCAAAAVWLWRQRKEARAARARPAVPRYPVVLAHGICGFDAIQIGPVKREYFQGVGAHLKGLGMEVHIFPVCALGSVARRAEDLARRIAEVPAKRVNIVAHSMGGLDARYAITRLGMAEKVASLTTVGTPHLGTPLADVGGFVGDRLGLLKILEKMGFGFEGIRDLTTSGMEAFNRDVPNHPRVTYGCYLAAAPRAISVNPLLVASYLFLSHHSGDNDGIVPKAAQRWGDVLGEIEADHWAQIGWTSLQQRFDAPSFYAGLLKELRGRGF
jgi:triacylglycerol lipase